MRQAEYPRPPDPGSTKIKDNQGAHRDLILDGLDLGPWAQIWPMGPFGSLGPKPGPVNKYGPKFGSGPKIARKTIDPPLRRRVFFEGVCLTAVILATMDHTCAGWSASRLNQNTCSDSCQSQRLLAGWTLLGHEQLIGDYLNSVS